MFPYTPPPPIRGLEGASAGSEVVKQEMFVKTDAKENNNKFWEITLHDDGSVHTRNGRVGSAGQSHVLGTGEALYDRKVREKTRGGYKKVDVVGAAAAPQVQNVSRAAEEQIGNGDPVVTDLVKRLARINKHQIMAASGGQMNLDLDTGIIRTPVGVVSHANVDTARNLLPQLGRFVLAGDLDSPKFVSLLNDYLMLVPQKVGSKRGWHKDVLPDPEAVRKQNDLLDQLEASIELAEDSMKKAVAAAQGQVPKVFDVRLTVLDGPETDRIAAFYRKTINRSHAAARLKPKRFFEVSIGAMSSAWEADGAKLDNRMELWHGTRAHNLLSILKSGLIIPKSGGSMHITGRMFGDGLYFSDQTTKSLNYAYGYWDGGSRDETCYMFLADVGMGKSYAPPAPFSGVPPKGYDSTYVRGGTARVQNNEMIVYRTGQANLKYLVEFGA